MNGNTLMAGRIEKIFQVQTVMYLISIIGRSRELMRLKDLAQTVLHQSQCQLVLIILE